MPSKYLNDALADYATYHENFPAQCRGLLGRTLALIQAFEIFRPSGDKKQEELYRSVKQAISIGKDDLEKYQNGLKALENAFKTYTKDKNYDFVMELNNDPNDRHFPRLIGLTLKNEYDRLFVSKNNYLMGFDQRDKINGALNVLRTPISYGAITVNEEQLFKDKFDIANIYESLKGMSKDYKGGVSKTTKEKEIFDFAEDVRKKMETELIKLNTSANRDPSLEKVRVNGIRALAYETAIKALEEKLAEKLKKTFGKDDTIETIAKGDRDYPKLLAKELATLYVKYEQEVGKIVGKGLTAEQSKRCDEVFKHIIRQENPLRVQPSSRTASPIPPTHSRSQTPVSVSSSSRSTSSSIASEVDFFGKEMKETITRSTTPPPLKQSVKQSAPERPTTPPATHSRSDIAVKKDPHDRAARAETKIRAERGDGITRVAPQQREEQSTEIMFTVKASAGIRRGPK